MTGLPRVAVVSDSRCFVATASFRLAALQVERIVPEALSSRLAARHEGGIRLAALVARMPVATTVELHWIGSPSLDPARPGTVNIRVDLHARAGGRTAAVEACLANSFAFFRQAEIFWPFAEFEPWAGPAAPFAPASCIRIGRRHEWIHLERPFEGPRHDFGFAPTDARPGSSTADSPVVRHTFPWVPSWDDASPLAAAMLASSVPLWVSIRVAPVGAPACAAARIETDLASCERFLISGGAAFLQQQTAALRDAILDRACLLREPALRVGVLLRAPGPTPLAVAVLAGQTFTGEYARGSCRSPFLGGFAFRRFQPCRAVCPDSALENDPMSPAEAACAFRLPFLSGEDACGLPARRNSSVAAHGFPAIDSGRGTVIGVNIVRGAVRPISIDSEQRLKHVFIPGMTGSGKSTLLKSMALQDIQQGHGVAVIDPHGDLVDDLLASPDFPSRRSRDIVFIDLAAASRVTPFNLLAWRTIEERDVIQDEILASIMRIYRDPQMFGPIFELNFRGMLKLLMGDRPRPEFIPTLLEFPLLYQKAPLRRWLRERISDAQVGDFIDELEAVRGENQISNLAPYVTSKLGRFLQDRRLCRMLGHGAMAVDFEDLLDRGGILCVKLARGQFPAAVADLLTAQILTRLRVAAMRRAARPNARRRPFFLYVDEFGSLARDENFAMLLSEARKYALGLVLATQYAGQLRGDGPGNSLSAVLGNVGSIVSLRLGTEDASLLAPVFYPAVSAQDLLCCPNFEGYARVHLNGVASSAFSVRMPGPGAPPDRERGTLLSTAALRRCGVDPAECDANAADRRSFIKALP